MPDDPWQQKTIKRCAQPWNNLSFPILPERDPLQQQPRDSSSDPYQVFHAMLPQNRMIFMQKK